ncbi:MAG: 23S rRNA (uracil(1939)-C(5))-methyltransferase RlmD [Erysipelotrichaceae bacterium]|nr:23S rRNA (uracil(1939)-C(5))-methyltransferase RlmD [Erysipelotrichaceae bacterium]
MKKCPVSEYCGGCQYLGMKYDKQVEIKQEKVEKLLSSFHHVEKIIPCKESLNYRNKIQISFGYDEDHHIISGYYIPNSHLILPIEECMLCDDKINQIVSSVKKIIIRNRISIYDERTKKGCLRHLLIRSTNTNEYMIVLVTGSFNLMKKERLVEEILRYNPDVTTIIHNINQEKSSSILGNRNQILYGKGYITDELCGLKFRISANSFYQVNRYQTEVLYNTAIQSLDLKKDDILIDAYCGTGTIGLSCAEYVKKVIGVELVPSAVKDAETNRKINQIENAEFICKDAGKFMESLSRNKTHIDAVIMDPPRSGSDIRFMSSMVKMKPDKIAYISCNPVTLERDLKYLMKYYNIRLIQPVDMFPFTQHIETVCILNQKNKI